MSESRAHFMFDEEPDLIDYWKKRANGNRYGDQNKKKIIDKYLNLRKQGCTKERASKLAGASRRSINRWLSEEVGIDEPANQERIIEYVLKNGARIHGLTFRNLMKILRATK